MFPNYQDKLKNFLSGISQGAKNFVGGVTSSFQPTVSPLPQSSSTPSFGQNLVRAATSTIPVWNLFNNIQENVPKIQTGISDWSAQHPTASRVVGGLEPAYNEVQSAFRSIPENLVSLQGVRDTVAKNPTFTTGIQPVDTVGNTAVNTLTGFGTGLLESLANAPSKFLYNAYRLPQSKSLPEAVGHTAGIIEPLLAVSTPKQVISGVGKAIDQPIWPSFGSRLLGAIKSGAGEGAQFGGAFGGLSGLQENQNAPSVGEQFIRSIPSTAIGAAAGAGVGGAVGGVGYGVKSANDLLQGQARTAAKDETAAIFKMQPKDRPIYVKKLGHDPQKVEDYLFKYYKNKYGQSGAIDFNAEIGQSELSPQDKTGQSPEAIPPEVPSGQGMPQETKQLPAPEVSFGTSIAPSNFEKEMDVLAAKTKVDLSSLQPKQGIPTTKMAGSEAQQVADVAQINAEGNKQGFLDIVKRYFGKLDAANTRGASYGMKAIKTPQGVSSGEIVHAIENPTEAQPEAVRSYLESFRQLDDQVFSEAKKAGIDIAYLRDHITHFWQNTPQEVQQAYQVFSRRYGGAQHRAIPTYEEGVALGLTPKYDNPGQILGESYRRLQRVKAGLETFQKLKDKGYVVPAAVGSKQPGFSPISAPGFPSSSARIDENTAVLGKWYAPTELANVINKAFSPAPDNGPIAAALSLGRKASSTLQDITLSGGLPATPANAFTVANVAKEITSGRVVSPIVSFFRSLTDQGTREFFNKNADQIIKMQERDIPIYTNLNIADLVKGSPTLKGIWNTAVNDPTFKRFMPMLQVNLFSDIERQALNSGKTDQEAADIAAKAVRNFYGSGSIMTNKTRPQLTKDVLGTLTFAPKFRESMINFWVNNVKALFPVHPEFDRSGLSKVIPSGVHLNNPMALENRTNIKFIAGATLTLGAMNYLNEKFTGHGMLQNPPGKEDKLLIPLSAITGDKNDQTVIGIPFLSSIATVPRALFREGKQIAQGNIPAASKDFMQSFSSSLIKPAADVLANSDYFGKPITTEDQTPQEKFGSMGKYLASQYISHPYIKELFDPRNVSDPLYQRVSRALELPFRFYDTKGIAAAYHFANRDQALKPLNSQERSFYDTLSNKSFAQDDPQNKIYKYNGLLRYPTVFQALQQTAIMDQNGDISKVDPLYLVTPNIARSYMRYQSLPPGSKDAKDLYKADPNIGQLSQARSLFFQNNPIAGQNDQITSVAPQPSAYVKQQMDAKNWNNPEVKAYMDAHNSYVNEQRMKLGLPQLETYQRKPRSPLSIVKFGTKKLKTAKMANLKVKTSKRVTLKLPSLKYKPIKTLSFKGKPLKLKM